VASAPAVIAAYQEETLDPQDWEALRRLGHRMVDDVLDSLRSVRERAPWQRPPEGVRARFRRPVPRAPEGAERAYQDFLETVLPYPSGNVHPRFWGWVMGTGTPLTVLSEMLAAAVLPVDREYRLEIAALRAAIAADRAEGRRPFAVVGNAGTVNTGATDDLAAIADLCEREGLWLHVDGAFGALAALVPSLRPRLAGMERADSLAFDLHKWGYLPYEVGCTLVRGRSLLQEAFTASADYLAPLPGGVAGRADRYADRGPQLSRGFRALKVWMGLKAEGVDKLGRIIAQNVDQAARLAARVDATPELERLAPAPLNVVCYRYVGDRGSRDLDALNRRVLVRLHDDGIAVPSYTTLDGRFALRVAIVNHRTRREDVDLLAAETVRLGRELEREGSN